MTTGRDDRESPRARRILRIDVTVADLDRTAAFYAALGFETVETATVGEAELTLLGVPASRARRLTMRLGRQTVGFTRFEPPGRSYPADSTSTDLWFQHIAIVVSAMDDAHRRVMAAGAAPITQGGPQTLPANTGGVTAFKFRDPDGHPLELLMFPEGVGDPVWQVRPGPLPFLGIDHSAIAVGDAVVVEAFYAGLGLTAAERSSNRGAGQQRLDDVSGDRVAVVPLQLLEEPPHLELLGYAVGTRRPMPRASRADDVWATRVWMEAEALPPTSAVLDDGWRATLVHDPDGHAIVLCADQG